MIQLIILGGRFHPAAAANLGGSRRRDVTVVSAVFCRRVGGLHCLWNVNDSVQELADGQKNRGRGAEERSSAFQMKLPVSGVHDAGQV